jgi:hyperosmotically inducible protein
MKHSRLKKSLAARLTPTREARRALRRRRALRTWLAALAVMVIASIAPGGTVASASAQNAASQSDRQLTAAIQSQLAKIDPSGSRLTVEVQDGIVTLSGMVPTLWVKQEAISRALKAGRVASVVSNLTIAAAESDVALARDVADRISKYDLYTVYDDIQGRVNNGVVSLSGAVTTPNKASDILERVAKVRGVQGIDNKLEVLPESQSDDRLRVTIANAIYRDEAFLNYSMVDPPIHVIVNRGHVTLTGLVRAEMERFKAESIARSVSGVLAFENKVEITNKRR